MQDLGHVLDENGSAEDGTGQLPWSCETCSVALWKICKGYLSVCVCVGGVLNGKKGPFTMSTTIYSLHPHTSQSPGPTEKRQKFQLLVWGWTIRRLL